MKTQKLLNILIFIIGIIAFIITRSIVKRTEATEGFKVQQDNKCSALTDCMSCATMDGCGWCGSSKKCLRTIDLGSCEKTDSYITSNTQCENVEPKLTTEKARAEKVFNEGQETRRMQLIYKYTDRIATNIAALVKDENKVSAKKYVQDNLCLAK
jgi:predicted nucleic acid-binding protein